MQLREFLPILIAVGTVFLGFQGLGLSDTTGRSVEVTQAASTASAGAFIGCGLGLVALAICSRREK